MTNTEFPRICVEYLHNLVYVPHIFMLTEWYKVGDGCCLLQVPDGPEALKICLSKSAKLINILLGTEMLFEFHL